MRYFETKLLIHPAFKNAKIYTSYRNSGKTTESIHVSGLRLADEIETLVHSLPKEIKSVHLSLIGHSLGGLISRYAIGWLYERGYFKSGFLVPTAYISIATPHVGIYYDRESSDDPTENNRRIFTNAARWVFYEVKQRVAKLFWRGQCITELYLEDGIKTPSSTTSVPDVNMPVLYQLSVPGSRYMEALALFKTRTLISNTHFDFQVDYLSSAISCDYPFDTPGDLVGMDLGDTCTHSESLQGINHPNIYGVQKAVSVFNQILDILRFPFDYTNYSADEDHTIFTVTYSGFDILKTPSLSKVGAVKYNEAAEKHITTPSISRSVGSLRAGITKNLQTLSWRRIDTRFNSLWCHDYLIGKSTIHIDFISNPKPASPILELVLDYLSEVTKE